MTKIGLGHFTFLDLPPAKLIKLARNSGFSFVGLRFHPVSIGELNWLPDVAEQKELARVMSGEGINLYDIETVVIDENFDPHILIPALDAAAALGAKRVNTCADAFDGLSEVFAQICDLADERGLGVDIECMAWRGINTPHACLDLIEQSGASDAGYLVDTLHHTRCGGSADDLSNMPASKLKSVQLCDAPLKSPIGTNDLLAEARGKRLLPGIGELPLREIINAVPIDAVISVELPSASFTGSNEARAKDIYAATKALFE